MFSRHSHQSQQPSKLLGSKMRFGGLMRAPTKGNVLDGKKIKALLGNEKEFNKFLNQYFDLLDEDKSGKLSRVEMQPALVRFSELLGLPPPGTVRETDEMVTHLFTRLMADRADEQVDRETFIGVSREFLTAISEQLAAKPLVVEVYDVGVLKDLAEDADDFKAMVDDVFRQFDENHSGKLTHDELRETLIGLGLVTPDGSKPELDAMAARTLGKYGGKDLEMDRAEFESMVRDLIQDFHAEMEAMPVIITPLVDDTVVVNGAFLRKLVKDKKFDSLAAESFQEWDLLKKGRVSASEVGIGFKKLCTAYRVKLLRPSEAEALCREVFEASDKDGSGFVEKDEFAPLLQQILLKLAAKLDKDPVLAKSSATSSNSDGTEGGLLGWFSAFATTTASQPEPQAEPPRARTADEIKAAYGRAPNAATLDAKGKLEERGKKLQEVSDVAEELDANAASYEETMAELAEKMKTRWW